MLACLNLRPNDLVLNDCGHIQIQNWWGSAGAASGLARRDDPPIEVIKFLTAPLRPERTDTRWTICAAGSGCSQSDVGYSAVTPLVDYYLEGRCNRIAVDLTVDNPHFEDPHPWFSANHNVVFWPIAVCWGRSLSVDWVSS